MATLSQLPKTVDKRKKRLGRGVGSGAGAKSGRGTTRHQTARTNMPLHFEGGQNKITKKYPLLRGKGRNKSIQLLPYTINVGRLNRFKKNTLVNVDTLLKEKVVTKDVYNRGVKVLGRGKLDVALQVDLPVSENAKQKIEKAGGKIV